MADRPRFETAELAESVDDLEVVDHHLARDSQTGNADLTLIVRKSDPYGGGFKLRVRVHKDFYQFQNRASAELWTGTGWSEVARRDGFAETTELCASHLVDVARDVVA